MTNKLGFFSGFNAGRRYLIPKNEHPFYKKGYKMGLWWNGLTRKERKLMQAVAVLGCSSVSLAGIALYLVL